MPIQTCDKCRGSGFLGVNNIIDKVDDDVKLEKIELIKCSNNCNNGFIYIVDDSSYDKNQISN